jgi:diaminohydroxyphosphoribosylaminopyrimidine deaminase / 5-amino-6-(5-phosphoribosylamino)uracil reductase
VLSDNPGLTCRLPGMLDRSPVRIVLDAQLRVPVSYSLVSTARETPTWIVTSKTSSTVAEQVLRDKSIEILRVDTNEGRIDLAQALKVLAERGVTRLMVEGGPTIAASFVRADLVDEAILFRSPKSIPDGIDALEGMPLSALTRSPQLKSIATEQVGVDTVEYLERV